MTHKLPVARNEAVVVQELEKETLIYDFNIDKAYCLNETSSSIYRYCDGETSFEELKRRYKYTDDLIYLTLEELQRNNLIAGEKIAHFAGMSRREAVKRVGLGTLAALPVISALAAPTAAQTASNCVAQNQNCIFDDFRQSNCCPTFRCDSISANTCQACRGTNVFYYRTFGGNADQATCDARPERNRCCNTTAAPIADGSDCLCP